MLGKQGHPFLLPPLPKRNIKKSWHGGEGGRRQRSALFLSGAFFLATALAVLLCLVSPEGSVSAGDSHLEALGRTCPSSEGETIQSPRTWLPRPVYPT